MDQCMIADCTNQATKTVAGRVVLEVCENHAAEAVAHGGRVVS